MQSGTAPSGQAIAYITAGAAGMYCGSCMHDNTLARALSRMGVDIQLIPTYTPIRTDEEDFSLDRVFFGGVNVYLEQRVPFYRYVSPLLGRLFDQPWLIRLATSRTSSADPKLLGALTVSMLRGTAGFQRAEVRKLCEWLGQSVRPHLINFSNILIAGCIPELKRRLDVPVVVTLQGDDIFLNQLPEPYREQALVEIQRLVPQVEGFLVHSQYYAQFMGQLLSIPAERFYQVPLGIDMEGFQAIAAARAGQTVGYLARLAPEKGLHQLVDAMLVLAERPGMQDVQLRIAGWLGEHNRAYAETQFARLDAGMAGRWEYVGSVDRAGKLEFLRGIDVLSVPTTYHEPKGLYVLEALAAGVPVVEPAHGAFPELLERLGGGLLVRPNHAGELADGLERLLSDADLRTRLANQGQAAVHRDFQAGTMAEQTWAVLEQIMAAQHGPG